MAPAFRTWGNVSSGLNTSTTPPLKIGKSFGKKWSSTSLREMRAVLGRWVALFVIFGLLNGSAHSLSCTSELQSLDCLPVFTHSPASLSKCYCTSRCPSLDNLRSSWLLLSWFPLLWCWQKTGILVHPASFNLILVGSVYNALQGTARNVVDLQTQKVSAQEDSAVLLNTSLAERLNTIRLALVSLSRGTRAQAQKPESLAGLAKLVFPVISFSVRAVKNPQCQTGIQIDRWLTLNNQMSTPAFFFPEGKVRADMSHKQKVSEVFMSALPLGPQSPRTIMHDML